jgi:hypothetical protein
MNVFLIWYFHSHVHEFNILKEFISHSYMIPGFWYLQRFAYTSFVVGLI